MRTAASLVAIALMASGCASGGEVAHECQAEPGSPLDVAGEPDWRRFADYTSWTDADGCLVRIDVLAERPGPDHCGWGDSQVIITGDPFGSRYEDAATDAEYVRDPNGVYGVAEFVAGYKTLDMLPSDATDTGYRQGERELWLSPNDPNAIFIRAPGSLERWPRGEVPACF